MFNKTKAKVEKYVIKEFANGSFQVYDNYVSEYDWPWDDKVFTSYEEANTRAKFLLGNNVVKTWVVDRHLGD